MNEAKKEILEAIKKGKPQPVPAPETPIYPFAGNPASEFIRHLLAFDGQLVEFRTREEAVKWLETQEPLELARHKIYSSCVDIQGNVKDEDLADLREAANISTCVTEGIIGVGEMGAIWVTDKSLVHPVCALLARRVYILLDADKIIGGLHEAYAGLDLRKCQYGSFYSGPSATADIEAVHITGAQGPLALTVLLYNRPDAELPPEIQKNPNADSSIWSRQMEEE